MVQQLLPQSTSLKPGQVSVSIDYLSNDKSEETVRLIKLALRTRFFTFDDRDDVKSEQNTISGMTRMTITAFHESLKPEPENQ